MPKKNKTMPNACVYLLALGGTIACASENVTDEFYSGPSVNIKDLISRLHSVNHINICYEQFLQQISHEMTDNELINLANRIDELVRDERVKGIVVTQGTNCIEETAYFINLTIKTKKPIVFTGSFYPSNAFGFDGTRNLYNAIYLAGNDQLEKLGVVLSFNDCIASARDAAKLNPSIIQGFSGNDFGLMGHIEGGVVHIKSIPKHRHTYISEFSINNIEKLPKVCIIYGHLGIDKMFVEAAISNNVAGIISAGMGKGYQPKELTEGLIKASQKGIFVVRSSRTGLGVINREPKIDDVNGFIAAGMISPQKARILLSVALSKTRDKSELQRIFIEY